MHGVPRGQRFGRRGKRVSRTGKASSQITMARLWRWLLRATRARPATVIAGPAGPA
ncbi:hypothetical protein [Micromonospora sp. NPDC049301]|uniref:hypothetical protein n=1 Tax=Micromonospora sp. NPDC049301 TaxID=3155723 RepID=UPI00342545C2